MRLLPREPSRRAVMATVSVGASAVFPARPRLTPQPLTLLMHTAQMCTAVTGALVWSGWSAYASAVREERAPAITLREEDLERQKHRGMDPESVARAAEQLFQAKQSSGGEADRLAELHRLETSELQRRLAQLRLAPKHMDFEADKAELKAILWHRGEAESRR